MRHRVAHRKLGRTKAHRRSLLRNLAASLVLHERIRTTLAKAKELRPFAEKLVTLGKKDTLHARRRALSIVPRKEVISKLFNDISPRFADRQGGYTRILKIGPRRGDGADMAFIEFVDYEFKPGKEAKEPAKDTKAAKKTKDEKKPEKEAKEKKKPEADVEEEEEKKPAKKVAKKTTKKAAKKTAKKAAKTTTTKKTTKKVAKKKATKKTTRKKKTS